LEAEELWDKSVVKLFRGRFAKYDPNKSSLDWWVKNVARNVGVDEWRLRKRRQQRSLDYISLSETPRSEAAELSSETCAHIQGYCTCPEEKEGGKSELGSLVGTALSLLSKSDQNVLWKRSVDKLPFDVIAESFGISETAARMRVSRALKRIKVEIERLCPREQRRRIKGLRR
jgi:RNA polymerase sigma factor (sigma-70 family)